MNISAKITGIKYTPLLCRDLKTFDIENLDTVLSKYATFILKVNRSNEFAVSWWVSAKRTRSYPYARVYDSLGFSGKKVTIIPVYKDEGKEGDRDFLQWDTISLMSLLGVYVIIAYYKDAEQSKRYIQKITNQRFDTEYIKGELKKLLSYQSDALHWNLEQIDGIGEIGQKALDAYCQISRKLGVEMHSISSAEKRIKKLLKDKIEFMNFSRGLAKEAQRREILTIQPKEKLTGLKAKLTIKNYLGGYYCFTSDEAEINEMNVYLIEGKHSGKGKLPSIEDIKDGLLKMILFTNLEDVRIGDKNYNPVPVLKLTVESGFRYEDLSENKKYLLNLLKEEAELNNFRLFLK